ncbi:MAG: glycoside hydrolase family 1 protein [Niveispirillum sp.]|uniref:glycoside hydrolase family 1 protein n=1 Tax=Niveispirillum sp. TaxID=1917217 RepID=UPI00403661E0
MLTNDHIGRRTLLAGLSAGAALAALPGRAAKVAFPKDFLWGAAISGHQTEGDNSNSDIWHLEQLSPGPFSEKSGKACDFLNLYAQDMDLASKLGFNAFRFSLEWSRIEPEEGRFDAKALDHYRRVAATCREKGLAPAISFNHFTTPLWFAKQGGWEVAGSGDKFARFCAAAVKAVGEFAHIATTLNEPNLGRLLRVILPPPILADMGTAMQGAATLAGSARFSAAQFGDQDAMLPNLLEGHRKGAAAIKAGPGSFPVGVSLAIVDDQAVGVGSQRDAVRSYLNDAWLDAAKADDFVGVQTYGRNRFDAKGIMHPPEGVELTQMGEEFYPQALGATVRYAHAVTGKPVYVTENGIATEDDTRRIAYIDTAVAALRDCVRDGVPVKGYLHWSFLDNYEWIFGYRPKFGLVAVDRTTQKRTPKPSAAYLGAIAKRNGAA